MGKLGYTQVNLGIHKVKYDGLPFILRVNRKATVYLMYKYKIMLTVLDTIGFCTQSILTKLTECCLCFS